MKKKLILVIFLLGTLIVSAIKIADDIIKRLGMEAKTAQSYIMANLIGRHENGPMNDDRIRKSFDIPYMRLLPSIIAGNKTESVKELCVYIKSYVNSEEFIKDYNNRKEDAMPLKDNNGRNITSLKKDKAVIEKNIKNYITDTKYVAEQQKLLDETQKGIDQIIANSKKTFPEKDKWEKLYPANPEIFIRQRLQEYLELVTTVDFNATLADPDKYRKRVFVNPVYEKKNSKWKACYRAGKEVNEVVTAFVKEWLKGEIISANKTSMAEPIEKERKGTVISSEKESEKKETDNQTSTTTNRTTTNPETPDNTVKEKKSILNKVKKVIKN